MGKQDMKDRRKPVVGETLFSLNVGNAARHRDQALTPVTVASVGRKFFKCSNGYEYHISRWTEKSEYSARSCLYETEQEWLDEKEAYAIVVKAREFFHCNNSKGMSIESLRQINAIIDAMKKQG